jgi:FMN phosphatase YigB (HAD superfamily)
MQELHVSAGVADSPLRQVSERLRSVRGRQLALEKMDARLFQTALDRLQVLPGQAVFIGNDSYRDIFGARQLGIKTPNPSIA